MGYRVPGTQVLGLRGACVVKRGHGNCCRELGGQLEGKGGLAGLVDPVVNQMHRGSRAHTEGVSCVRGKGGQYQKSIWSREADNEPGGHRRAQCMELGVWALS